MLDKAMTVKTGKVGPHFRHLGNVDIINVSCSQALFPGLAG
ncbi:MAG: hypothetical protein ACU0DH_13285 [Paracoccus sp. (in: a-proteobacteria)]